MAERPTTWKPGQSGNPNGRPPKPRALTELLRKAGNRTIPDVDGTRRSRKRIVANLLWNLAISGSAEFPNGEKLIISPEDWLNVVKFIYTHIDGPPKQEVGISTDDGLTLIIQGPSGKEV